MNNMKCVKCNTDLERIGDFYTCTNPHCTLCGDKDIWQELICTRKALDVAMDGLKRIEKLTEPSYKDRNLEALALAVNTFSGEIIEQINQRNNNE